jgi:hypothetical protein
MAVIGFLRYTDFIAELEQAAGQNPGPAILVRVQHYHRTTYARDHPIFHLHFFVIATALVVNDERPDILVCRFNTGTAQRIYDYDRDTVRHCEQRNQRAVALLKTDLEKRGYIVRPGIYAEADESKSEADPGDLFGDLGKE